MQPFVDHIGDLPLIGEGIVMRLFVAADVEAVTGLCQDPEIPRWTTVPSPYRREDAALFIGGQAARIEAGRALELAIATDDEPERVVGCVGLHHVNGDERTAEIGYWLGAPYRGRGIMSVAVTLFTDWAIGSLGFERIELRAAVDNTPSHGVAQAAGFKREGTLRSVAFRDSRIDVVLFSLVPSDLA